jgi:hypothetical protein
MHQVEQTDQQPPVKYLLFKALKNALLGISFIFKQTSLVGDQFQDFCWPLMKQSENVYVY